MSEETRKNDRTKKKIKNKKKYEIDMCNGAILPKLLAFTLPLMCSSVLQLLFNAADIIVVGSFAGDTALAAVGSNTALINLLTNFFLGLSIGANVLVARFYGAKAEEDVSDTVHTAMLLSIFSGIIHAADPPADGDSGRRAAACDNLSAYLFCWNDIHDDLQLRQRNPAGGRRYETATLLSVGSRRYQYWTEPALRDCVPDECGRRGTGDGYLRDNLRRSCTPLHDA